MKRNPDPKHRHETQVEAKQPPANFDRADVRCEFRLPGRGAFLWGTATAAFQVEGDPAPSSWADWEQQPGRILGGDRSGLACDWWNGRWREDFDRAAAAHQNAHRLSLDWARIQPAPDRWDEEALDRYRLMLRGLTERGLTPLVTLHHFNNPLWLEERGGWENPEAPALFAAFARRAAAALKGYVSIWVTINEPNVFVYYGYVLGAWPPGKRSLDAALRAAANLVRGHAAAYRAIHAEQPEAQVGAAHNIRGMRPESAWNPLDRGGAAVIDHLFNSMIPQAMASGTLNAVVRRTRIPEAARTQDFIGLNYYTRTRVHINPLAREALQMRFPPGADLSDNGEIANDPAGLFKALRWAQRFTGQDGFPLPVYITENGVEDADDDLRPRYLLEHVHQVWRALNFCYPVRGYFHWSLVDNFEWERGWTQRFGLWELDPLTQVRRRRRSADLYAEICKLGGISTEMAAKYAPETVDKLFPI